jgi:hypothetical protein
MNILVVISLILAIWNMYEKFLLYAKKNFILRMSLKSDQRGKNYLTATLRIDKIRMKGHYRLDFQDTWFLERKKLTDRLLRGIINR